MRLIFAMFCIWSIAFTGFALDKNSIVGMWLFDDENDIAKDYSGNGHDGTPINDPEWVDDGVFGGALLFTAGSAHNVRVPIPHNDTVTIAMWGNYRTLASNNIGLIHVQAGDFENADPGSKTIGMWVENSTSLWGRIIPDGIGNVNFPKNESLEADTWYHIAMVIDADTGKATQYLNAQEAGQVDYAGTLTQYDFANIGRQGDETWDGMIDEVVIFSEALSINDLKILMDDGIESAFSVESANKLATTWGKLRMY